MEAVKPGSTRPLLVLRDGKEMTLQVKCQEMPANFGLASDRSGGGEGPAVGEASKLDELGIQVQEVTPALAEQLKVKVDHGVAITDVKPGSPAEAAGLSTGMVITEANRQPINSVADLRKALSKSSKSVLLLVRSEAGTQFIPVPLHVDNE